MSVFVRIYRAQKAIGAATEVANMHMQDGKSTNKTIFEDEMEDPAMDVWLARDESMEYYKTGPSFYLHLPDQKARAGHWHLDSMSN